MHNIICKKDTTVSILLIIYVLSNTVQNRRTVTICRTFMKHISDTFKSRSGFFSFSKVYMTVFWCIYHSCTWNSGKQTATGLQTSNFHPRQMHN